MNKEAIYRITKMKEKDNIVIIKSGNFYKTFSTDAIVLWHIFGYSITNNVVSFPSTALNKVISLLLRHKLGVIEVKSLEEYYKYEVVDSKYQEYVKICNIEYNKYNKINEIKEIVNNKINDNIDNYYCIKDYLDKL